jgi:hypothetical protein
VGAGAEGATAPVNSQATGPLLAKNSGEWRGRARRRDNDLRRPIPGRDRGGIVGQGSACPGGAVFERPALWKGRDMCPT